MSKKRDYYDVLGVPRNADEKTLKAAYRKLAMDNHPDRNPDDPAAEARFKEANEAYAVLSDADKRAAYDRMGHAAFEQGGMGAAGVDPEEMLRQVFGGSGFGDIFEQVFGMGGVGPGSGRRQGPRRGADLRVDLEIDLEDAYAGKAVEIDVPSTDSCERCSGSGAEPGSSVETCPGCGGAGVVRTSQGVFTMQRTCAKCGGQGRYVKEACTSCDGSGRVRVKRTLSVNIPAGVEDGTRIRLAGEGEAGPHNGGRGDLYLFTSVRPHEIFERDGPDLYCRAPIAMTTAALGGEVEIPTIEGGRVKVRVDAGAQTGKRVRLRGKGMSQLRGGQRGDMYIELFVETPTRLSARQRELLEEFCKESGDDCHPESKNFLTRARRFWDDLSGGEAPRA